MGLYTKKVFLSEENHVVGRQNGHHNWFAVFVAPRAMEEGGPVCFVEEGQDNCARISTEHSPRPRLGERHREDKEAVCLFVDVFNGQDCTISFHPPNRLEVVQEKEDLEALEIHIPLNLITALTKNPATT